MRIRVSSRSGFKVVLRFTIYFYFIFLLLCLFYVFCDSCILVSLVFMSFVATSLFPSVPVSPTHLHLFSVFISHHSLAPVFMIPQLHLTAPSASVWVSCLVWLLFPLLLETYSHLLSNHCTGSKIKFYGYYAAGKTRKGDFLVVKAKLNPKYQVNSLSVPYGLGVLTWAAAKLT